jgi:hypothetical protein
MLEITAAALAVLFALGLAVSNIALLGLGWSDFSLIRPWYIVVGLCLVLFISLPLLVVAAPYFTLFAVPRLASRPASVRGFAYLLTRPLFS